MPTAGDSNRCCKPSSHDWLWWLLLLPLLFAVLLAGLFVVSCRADRFPYLFGVAAFSIAYALHFFSVSAALCGVYIQEVDEAKFRQLREKEYGVVTSAMCALAGGLGILLSGGLCAIDCTPTLWRLPVIPLVYAASAVLLFASVFSTTVLETISQSLANVRTSGTAVVAGGHEPGARTPWQSRWGHGVQAAPGAPRGVKPVGRRAGRRKARGTGGESLARSAARYAYAAIHNAP